MESVLLAWLVGEGMMVWRIAKTSHSFPIPARLLVASAAYGACAVLQQVGHDEAGKVSKTFAWGLTIATAFLAFQTKSTPKTAGAPSSPSTPVPPTSVGDRSNGTGVTGGHPFTPTAGSPFGTTGK